MAHGCDTPRKPYANEFTFICIIITSMTSILFGLDIPVSTITDGIAIFTKCSIEISWRQENIFLLVRHLIVDPIASLAAGGTTDLIGPRYTILSSLIVFFFGFLITILAPNYVHFAVGLSFISVGVAHAHVAILVYITELASYSTRGFLSSFYEVFMIIGEILGNVIVYTTSNSSAQLRFRLMLGLGTVLWVLLTLSALALPESPYWLVKKDRDGDAKQVLAKTSNSEEEVESRLKDIKLAAGILLPGWSAAIAPWRALFVRPSPSVRRALIAAIGINVFRNTTGIDVVASLSSNAFLLGDKCNNPNFELLKFIVAIFALINISLNIIAGYLADKIGRRPLLLTSIAGIIPFLVGAGLILTMYSRSDEKTWSVLYIVMILFSNVFFSIGLGPITWLYSTEVFPMHLRAQGASVGGAVYWVISGVMDYISFIKGKAISGGAFFTFAGISSVGLVFSWKLLPETLGNSSEERGIGPCSSETNHIGKPDQHVTDDPASTSDDDDDSVVTCGPPSLPTPGGGTNCCKMLVLIHHDAF